MCTQKFGFCCSLWFVPLCFFSPGFSHEQKHDLLCGKKIRTNHPRLGLALQPLKCLLTRSWLNLNQRLSFLSLSPAPSIHVPMLGNLWVADSDFFCLHVCFLLFRTCMVLWCANWRCDPEKQTIYLRLWCYLAATKKKTFTAPWLGSCC